MNRYSDINTKQNILIVDDHPANLVALESLLEELDLNIFKADSGKNALSVLLEHDVAIVLLDVMMPEMDGYEVAGLMKGNKQTRNIPIIFITASQEDKKHTFKGYKIGAVDFLYKPVEPEILISKVNVFIELNKQKQKLQYMASMLSQSEEKYKKIIETTDDAIFIADAATGLITETNMMAEKMLGIPREQIIGIHQKLLHPLREAERYEKLFKESILKGKSTNEYLVVVNKDGKEIPVDIRANVIKLGDNLLIAGFFRDVTQRKLAEEALKEKTVYLDNILRYSLNMAIVATDIDFIIKYFNPMAEKLFELKSDDVTGKSLQDVVDMLKLDVLNLKDGLGKIIKGQGYSFEYCIIKTEAKKIIEGNMFGIRDSNGVLTGCICMFNDVTEKKKTEDELKAYRDHLMEMVQMRTSELKELNSQLEVEVGFRRKMEKMLKLQTIELTRSNEELEHFAYLASHDLQEPLRKVTSFTELLQKRYQGVLDEKADKFIGYIVDGTQRMQKLINDLLAYSRVGTNQKVIEPVDLSKTLNIVLSNLQRTIDETQSLITYDILPVVMADETHMVQLFQNLIGNAIKFRGNEQPMIHISVKTITDESIRGFATGQCNGWHFSVTDNGIGIKVIDYDKIFMMFHRLHGRGEYAGTGIGLAICKKIVERHGGRIWVESEYGKGTSFHFTLFSNDSVI